MGVPNTPPLRGTVSLALAGALLAAAVCTSAQEAARKNVLLITLDGLRQDHMSAFGYSRPTTPNIDWLAANGVAFRNVVPTSCSTQQSLTSLFTSRGFEASLQKDGNVTLAETFTAAGYDTAGFVGSPVLTAKGGFGKGFAVYEEFRGGGPYVTADQPVGAAIRYLQSRKNIRPFFVYMHFEEPHPPWTHGSPWLEGEEKSESFFDKGCTYMPSADELARLDDRKKANLIAKYDGALRYADEQIGHLLEQLRTSGTLANTVIAISTDHGFELVDRYSATHGQNPFDEVIRTFLVLYDRSTSFADVAPERLQARIFDIGPTLMALAHIGKPPTAEGVDLLARPSVLPEYAFAKCYNAAIIRSLEYKLIDVDFSLAREYKENLPVGLEEGRHLFALRIDPGERNDILATNPRIAEQMESARASLYGPLPTRVAASTPAPTEPVDPVIQERLRVLGYK